MMVAFEQQAVIRQLLGDALRHPGDVVEAGCHEGSTSVELLRRLAGTDRTLHLFDSFEGLPSDSGYGGQMVADTTVLTERLAQANAELQWNPVTVFAHHGWFADTMPHRLPNTICFAFVDCDVASSLHDCLPPIIERLTGTLVIHDFAHSVWGPHVRGVIEELGLAVTTCEGMAIYRAEVPTC